MEALHLQALRDRSPRRRTTSKFKQPPVEKAAIHGTAHLSSKRASQACLGAQKQLRVEHLNINLTVQQRQKTNDATR